MMLGIHPKECAAMSVPDDLLGQAEPDNFTIKPDCLIDILHEEANRTIAGDAEWPREHHAAHVVRCCPFFPGVNAFARIDPSPEGDKRIREIRSDRSVG